MALTGSATDIHSVGASVHLAVVYLNSHVRPGGERGESGGIDIYAPAWIKGERKQTSHDASLWMAAAVSARASVGRNVGATFAFYIIT